MLQRFSVDARDRATLAFAAVGALLLVPVHVVAREAKVSQAPIMVAEAPSASHERHTGNNHSENRDPYVYVNGDSRSISGSEEDLRRVDSLKSKYGSQFLWFKRGSSEYVITDATTLKTIDALQAPQIALGHQQEELGNRQRAWDRERGEFIHKAGELSRKQELYREKTLELGRERAQMPEDRQDPAKEPIAGKRRELVPSAEDVLRDEADVGRRIAELGRRWGELEEEKARLGKQQREIGWQVQEMVAQTLETAVANGIAKRPTP